jgi:hypothetical protein
LNHEDRKSSKSRLPVFKEFHHDLAAVSTKDDESDSDFEKYYSTKIILNIDL